MERMMTRRALLAAALPPVKWNDAVKPLADAVAAGKLRAAVLRVTQGDGVYEKAFGAATVASPFLIASITKPMTAAAVMTAVDAGKLQLDAPAGKMLPGLDGRITLRHLLKHSSGLPDMLPENIDLRKRNAPLREWAKLAMKTPLLFAPGEKVSYQSMGILLAATMAEMVSGLPMPKLLEQRIYGPLGMKDTFLGLGRYRIADTVQNQTEFADPIGEKHWDWNSQYWRTLAAPWGGAHSTAADITKLLRYFMKPGQGPLKPETAKLMVTAQNAQYGLGWRLTPGQFGHSGSTGTMCWAHREKDVTFVLLTSLPLQVSQKTMLDPVSKAVQGALLG
jgi:CubicO group peptidase (beta-lactamase class C family)